MGWCRFCYCSSAQNSQHVEARWRNYLNLETIAHKKASSAVSTNAFTGEGLRKPYWFECYHTPFCIQLIASKLKVFAHPLHTSTQNFLIHLNSPGLSTSQRAGVPAWLFFLHPLCIFQHIWDSLCRLIIPNKPTQVSLYPTPPQVLVLLMSTHTDTHTHTHTHTLPQTNRL